MKNIFIYAILFVTCMGMSGCVKDFLDRPAHNVTPEIELNDMNSLSSSVYAKIMSLNSGAGEALLSMGEVASDNALRGSIMSDAGGKSPDKQFNQFQNFDGLVPTTTQYISGIWNGLYPGVDQANINIRALERLFPNGDPDLKKALIAENRFIRSWCYMFLVNTFGEVVLLPDNEITPSEYGKLTNDKSINELYDYIVSDMRHAAQTLPTKDEWSTTFLIPWQGRAHNGSGKGYLAKALLYQAANITYNKTDATTTAQECYTEIVDIVSSLEGQYTLVDDYEQIFRPEGNYNTESMFEIGTKSTADGKTRFAGWHPVQPRGYQGYGRFAPSLNLINQYEKDSQGVIIDKRYAGTVLFGATTLLSGMEYPATTDPMRNINGVVINGITANNVMAAGWPNRFCRKAVQPKPESTSSSPETNLGGANLKFLRWGEVLLIGAEAAYHIGDMDNAKTWLKQVRLRAGLDTDMVDGLVGEALIEQIWIDKRLEIAMEWSNRYFEMVRIDKINPGYMKRSFSAKIDDELAGIKNHLDATDGWAKVYNMNNFPMTPDNYKSVMPLRNGLQVPRHYTMPISSSVFITMPNVKQTTYYR